jgi:hypothetical protein
VGALLSLLGRLHAWVRYVLWVVAVMLMILFASALVLGSWERATDVWFWIALVLLVGFFAWNIWGGWVEWRGRKERDR